MKQKTKPVSVRKFKGMRTSAEPSQITDSELQYAWNVEFNTQGILVARKGLKLKGASAPEQYWLTGFGYADIFPNWPFMRSTFFGGVWRPTYQPLRAGIVDENNPSDAPDVMFVFQTGEAGGDNTNRGKIVYNVDKFLEEISSITPAVATPIAPATTVGQGYSNSRGVQYGFAAESWLYFSDGMKVQDEKVSTWVTASAVPGAFQYATMLIHQDRMIMASMKDKFNRLYYSTAGKPENWTSIGDEEDGGFLDISPLDGDFIQTIISFKDSLYVFKENSVWIVYTSGLPANWSVRRFGTLGAWGATPTLHEGLIYWVGPDGAFSFDGVKVTRISDQIQDIFTEGKLVNGDRQFPESYHEKNAIMRADAFRDEYVFFTMDGYGGKKIYCYNIRHKAWTQWFFQDGVLDSLVQDIFAVKNSNREGFYVTLFHPTQMTCNVYKLSDTYFQDQYSMISGYVTVGSTATVINTTATAGLSHAGEKLNILYKTGASANEGETRTILSNTIGANASFTLTEPLSSAVFDFVDPFRSTFTIFREALYTIHVVTRIFDFGTPLSFKRMKKGIVEARVSTGRVITKVNVDEATHQETNINIESNGNIGIFPFLGGVRGKNIEVTIDVFDTSVVRFQLYGLHVFVGERGNSDEQIERPDTGPSQ